MDLNKKIQAIEYEDDKENKLFNESLKLQKKALDLKDKITENIQKLTSMNSRLTDFEIEIFKQDYEVTVLEIHQKETDQYIKTKLIGIATKEEDLKRLKLKFKQEMNELMDSLNLTSQGIQLIDNSKNKQVIPNEKELKNEMYRLEAEVEALKIYENYQNMRVKEIENINIVLKELEIEEEKWKL
ncbi:uncharacterized protein LOC143190268 [Rhynchophorus ferrugineus]|uniref:uncharacterized protein LOC143190268 n=1 Tax=Rhynchophorus ferrugineus TaxID=354439 RepID=UPI003FCEB1AF